MNVHPIEKKSAGLTKCLKDIQADTVILYLKTLNYHWHVKGPAFYVLHEMFESQYESLAEAIDEIAERLVQLGEKAPGTTNAILQHASIKESDHLPKADAMIKDLVQAHTTVAELCKKGISAANKNSDDVTADLLIGRLKEHEKVLWMLQSSL